VGLRPAHALAEPPPETTKVRLADNVTGGACIAPQYVVQDLLQAEGFTDVQYLKLRGRVAMNKALLSGDIDINVESVGLFLVQLDAGDPLVILSGIHVGCFALFATERIRTIRELKGKAVSVT